MERKRHAAASALNHFRWLHKKPFWTVEPNKAKRRLKVRREARKAIHRWFSGDEGLEALIRGVKDHDTRGWDFVIECCEDAEIVAAIGDAKTVAAAVRRVAVYFTARPD